MRCFFTARLWLHSIWHKKRSHVFTGSYAEQRFVTLVSSMSFFLAVTWAVCVCMDRCVRCWQLLISDCKVLIMRAADLFLNSTTSKTLLEGEIKHAEWYYFSKMMFEYQKYMMRTGRNLNSKQSICLRYSQRFRTKGYLSILIINSFSFKKTNIKEKAEYSPTIL